MEKDIIIVGFSKPSSEGVTIHLNKPSSLKTTNINAKEFWVSWDKIGRALIKNYTEDSSVESRNKLREEFSKDPDNIPKVNYCQHSFDDLSINYADQVIICNRCHTTLED